jgi:hypothetical protein
VGAAGQVARRLTVVLEIKKLAWLPEMDTDPNSRIENSYEAAFSTVLNQVELFGCTLLPDGSPRIRFEFILLRLLSWRPFCESSAVTAENQ